MRKGVTAEQCREQSDVIAESVAALAVFKRARTVALYLALPGEVDTAVLREYCYRQGQQLCVPAWSDSTCCYAFAGLSRDELLIPGPMNVLQPATLRWKDADMLDVVVTPGVGFDILGNRVGFGAGHYDQLLGRCTAVCTRIGVAFDWQIQRHVPVEEHDVPMHWIVTNERTLACD